jgi:energy-coupling factor transporter transmembrane protein EcfT
VPLITPVLLGSLVDARERTFALEARGFAARPTRTAYRVVADPPIDRWLRLLILLASVGVVLVAFGVVPR